MTGVQTCALPICDAREVGAVEDRALQGTGFQQCLGVSNVAAGFGALDSAFPRYRKFWHLASLSLSARIRYALIVEHEVGYELFELLVLVPQLSHFRRLAQCFSIALAAPAVESGFRDSQLPAYLDGWRSSGSSLSMSVIPSRTRRLSSIMATVIITVLLCKS